MSSVLWTTSNGVSQVHSVALNKVVVGDYPMLLNKEVYGRLSNAFD